jgi:hypothetical protein
VLQYGEQGGRWELQSWFVDANDRHYPVVTAPAVSVSPGDKITSYMSLSTDNSTWTVSGTNTNTGKDSTLRIAFAKAGDVNYDWAMLVNENINVNEKCFLMPESSNVTFTRLVTYLVTYCIWWRMRNSATISPVCTKDAPLHHCPDCFGAVKCVRSLLACMFALCLRVCSLG